MKTKRTTPYIWVTWVSGYMSGDKHCYSSSWKKAQFQNLDTVKSNFDQVSWMINHTDMVSRKRIELESEGWVVTVEEQNKFMLTGNSGAKLGGKADLVAVKDGIGKVIDCKTGTPRVSDVVQVQIYMFALGRQERYQGITLSGELNYKDHDIAVPAESVNDEFRLRLFKVLSILTSEKEPGKTPSFAECNFCAIAQTECSERLLEDPNEPLVGSFDF